MSTNMNIKTFNLPDLGEGLPEAEIVTWHVKVGDIVFVDQLMVSVETAKAIVEVPSPFDGIVSKLYGDEGDIIKTHSALVDFQVETANELPKFDEDKFEAEALTVELDEDVIKQLDTESNVVQLSSVKSGEWQDTTVDMFAASNQAESITETKSTDPVNTAIDELEDMVNTQETIRHNLAEQRAAEAAKEKAAKEKAAKEAAEKAAEEAAAEEARQQAIKLAAEQKAIEEKVAAERKIAEAKLAEEKLAQEKLEKEKLEKETAANQAAPAEIVTFFLPDLGEGLPEAEIVTWHVAEGDTVKVDQTMVSVETAKAVVEVPSPHNGTIAKLYAEEGDIVKTHAALVDFNVSGSTTPATSTQNADSSQAAPANDGQGKIDDKEDEGTVVGKMQSSDKVLVENVRIGSKRRRDRKNKTVSTSSQVASQPSVSQHGKFKAAPSIRIAAKEKGIDLSQVNATGKFGQVTKSDLAAFDKTLARTFSTHSQEAMAPQTSSMPMHPGAGVLSRPASDTKFGEAERLRGPLRAMNMSMSASRDQVSQCTLFDDADIHYWSQGQDITGRILRSLVAGCFAAPELNAWFNQDDNTRTMHEHIDVAMAVDTPNGLIVPVLRQVQSKNQQQLRQDLNHIKVATRERTVSPADMAKPTITLSNFGMMAGRYATPVIVPPMVTIVGTGGLRHDVVAVMGGIEVHKRIPLSLTFDHRCITGGEACTFLAAMIKDLEKPF